MIEKTRMWPNPNPNPNPNPRLEMIEKTRMWREEVEAAKKGDL